MRQISAVFRRVANGGEGRCGGHPLRQFKGRPIVAHDRTAAHPAPGGFAAATMGDTPARDPVGAERRQRQ